MFLSSSRLAFPSFTPRGQSLFHSVPNLRPWDFSSLCKTTPTQVASLSTLSHFGGKWQGSMLSQLSWNKRLVRTFAVKTLKVPKAGDSITDGTLEKWFKKVGDFVQMDELVANIETDKTNIEIRAPQPGVITELLAKEGDTVLVDSDLLRIDLDGKAPAGSAKKEEPAAAPKVQEAAKGEAPKAAPKVDSPKVEAPKVEAPKTDKAPSQKQDSAVPVAAANLSSTREERRVPLSRMRLRIAERLKHAQNTFAMLTTFNDVDMSNLMAMRESYKEEFEKKHGVKLGFMSAFVKASTIALQEQPNVNAVIDDADKCIVYRDYVDIGVAVATPTGLVVPIIKDCDKLSFAEVEKTIAHYGKKARDKQIAIEDMEGGTFTISNGGVYGSLMGTPIINPPQSAILGMHAINKRVIVVNDQMVIRPMMYVALTYDHRIIDGKDAVTFLKRIKELVEDPKRILLA